MNISITVTDKDLKVIDDYCKSNGYKRSTFLIVSAIQKIRGIPLKDSNDTWEEVMDCQAPNQYCRLHPTRKVKVEIPDWEQGEIKKELYLCDTHIQKIIKEGGSISE